MKAIPWFGSAGRSNRAMMGGWQLLGLMVVSSTLYVLSFGPAVRLSEEGWLAPGIVTSVYRPLGLARGTPLQHWLNTYVSWWLPRPFHGDLPESAGPRRLY